MSALNIPPLTQEQLENSHYSMWDDKEPPKNPDFDQVPVLTTMLYAVAGGDHEKMLEGARLIEIAVKHGYEMAIKAAEKGTTQ